MSLLHILSTIELTDAQVAEIKRVSPSVTVQIQPDFGSVVDRESVEIIFGDVPSDVQRFPRLNWVQGRGAGVDRLVDKPIWQSEVVITTASGIHLVPIAERTLAMMLAFRANMPLMWQLQQNRKWPEQRMEDFSQPDLRGSTLGIVGYGAIGGEVARQAQALGMRVLALNRSGKRQAQNNYLEPGVGDPDDSRPEQLFAADQLHEMLPLCDHVVVLAPLTQQTRGLFDASAFAAMRTGAYFYNYGRGGLVDENALIAALQSGHIAGAGLDVFETEPLPPGSPLWDMPNVIISPHVGGWSATYIDRLVRLFAANLQRYLDGLPLYNIVDRQREY
jgi:phosphoglycerate dehydrogenase-like enzyme